MKNRSIFYKERSWDDFHFYNGSILPQVKIVQPSIYHEYRGSITTTYHSDFYDKLLPANDRNEGLKFNHDRYSKSKINVLRGLHYDDKTWKLISCPHGKLYLVVLDLREKQPNYGKWESFIIGPETGTQVLIPPMFANGHYVMENDSIFQYKLAYPGEYYDDDKQGTVFWNDKRFNIDWPTETPILSKRDKPSGI
jgi:dTDP-4-dehydrorhamnose 3,5-epimerase|tara:strand:- start:1509 stop:2093 length:585 start_codon:yes stop_codon:yes gene_type:complete